jgi:hypothetical protein
MRAVCIARHRILAEHYRDYFADLGIRAVPAVGFGEGIAAARREGAELVLCDYELLATATLEQWEHDDRLTGVPLVAVSLTRRPEDAHAATASGVAGFLYLPTLAPEDVACMLRAATGHGLRAPADALRWPPSAPEPERDLRR